METKGIIISQKEYERLTELEKNFNDKVKENKESFKKGLEDAIKGNLVKVLWINDKYYADLIGCDLSDEGIDKFIRREDADFVNVNTPITVICKEHGEFSVKPRYFLRGYGCPQCDGFGKYTTDRFVSLAKQKHGDKYDYSLVDYKYSREPVEIICKKCGTHFFQAPNSHLIGSGCPNCALLEQSLSLRHTTEMFIEKAKKVHGNRYSYEHTEYVKDNMPVTITCRKHGDFQQIANAHLQGCGCPRCSISRGEEKVMLCLDKFGINYETQYKINNESLFCENKRMYLDFFIPSLNVAIEYQGEQHYRPTGFVDNEERFAHQQERDNAVRQYCEEHKIKLIEIPYTEYDNIEEILTKELNIKKHD